MKHPKRIIANIIEILIGICLIICSCVNLLDEFWSGMGGALIAVGALQLFRLLRYSTDKAYQETVDVAVNDERNKYISMKAWSWAGYLFVLIAAVATIVLKVLGYDTLVPIASGCVCLIVILYWLSYLILRKKY
jgi:uncharacterized membrane protein